jgi:hypothetical protein
LGPDPQILPKILSRPVRAGEGAACGSPAAAGLTVLCKSPVFNSILPISITRFSDENVLKRDRPDKTWSFEAEWMKDHLKDYELSGILSGWQKGGFDGLSGNNE